MLLPSLLPEVAALLPRRTPSGVSSCPFYIYYAKYAFTLSPLSLRDLMTPYLLAFDDIFISEG